MFKNYVIIALRAISKQKISSLIAILGLALGITSSLILYLYIDYQLNYEDFLPKESGIKRIISKRKDIYQETNYYGDESVNKYTSNLFKENVDSIEDVATYSGYNYLTLLIDNELYNEDISFISNNFFNVIPFEVLLGDRGTLFSEPNSIVLDKEFADKYFPEGIALGQSITIQMETVYILKVTGVVNIPQNSHFKSGIRGYVSENILAELVYNEREENIFSIDSQSRDSVYIKVESGSYDTNIVNELNNIIKDLPKDKNILSEELQLEDFKDIHLYSKDQFDDARNPRYMLVLLSILVFTLLISSVINSVSILTAASINRTKEVGVRVVMGSSKRDLIFQFLTESIILTFISLIVALVLTEIFLPYFSKFVFVDLNFEITPMLIIFITILTPIIGIISGLYPAFYLSNLKVVESLKGKSLLRLGKSKKVLVVSQFLISSIIFICCLIMNNELKLLNKVEVGFNMDKLIYVFPGLNFDSEPKDKLQNLKNEINEIPGIDEVSFSSYIPYSDCYAENNTFTSEEGISHLEYFVKVDPDYFNTIDIIPIEGEIKLGTVVIMESVRKYRNINVGDIVTLGSKNYTVGAIIKDYFLRFVLAGESPKFHIVSEDDFYFQIIKYSGEANLKEIKKIWKTHYPNKSTVVEIHNQNDQNNIPVIITLKKVMNLTMILTMFICGLGLFGLILHSVKQKNKEIGIRKVLGADLFSIVKQFVGDLMKYVIIGVGLGIPLGAYLVTFGLKTMGFPFKIHNLYQISILSGLIIILVGILLTFLMVFKSATSNPSNALRYE